LRANLAFFKTNQTNLASWQSEGRSSLVPGVVLVTKIDAAVDSLLQPTLADRSRDQRVPCSWFLSLSMQHWSYSMQLRFSSSFSKKKKDGKVGGR
jgi:hypothetical protein